MYDILRLAVLMITLVAVLAFNATNFDVTEIKSIITVFLVAAGMDGIRAYVKKSP